MKLTQVSLCTLDFHDFWLKMGCFRWILMVKIFQLVNYQRTLFQTLFCTPSISNHFPVDRKLESWKAACMKTTIDLPEDLVREMKFRAVREGRKLREVAEEVFRRGLAAPAASCRPGGRHRVRLPLVPSPPSAKFFELSGKRLLELEMLILSP